MSDLKVAAALARREGTFTITSLINTAIRGHDT